MLAIFGTRSVKAHGDPTVYIRADGSIDPPDGRVVTLDNITYVLRRWLVPHPYYDGLVIERNDIVVDGKGNWIEGYGYDIIPNEAGNRRIYLSGTHNVTVTNMTISACFMAVVIQGTGSSDCGNNTVTGINIVQCPANEAYGDALILVNESSNNNITGNNIEGNGRGIELASDRGRNNLIGNNITDNTYGIVDDGFSIGGITS
jgi:parallel beta-helix repeat protein